MKDVAIPFALIGGGGEPVDFPRTIAGHGVTTLPPMQVDAESETLTITLRLPHHMPRSVTIRSNGPGEGAILVHGGEADQSEQDLILAATRHILRLDQDLSDFYRMAETDPGLAWVTRGAGRMTRCQTVFEDVVKTICTTNCAWSATVRMVHALIEHLGEPTGNATAGNALNRLFPTPSAMASADETFYREIVRCGYRGTYLKSLAGSVANGEVELESLAGLTSEQMSDDELAKTLIALPGVGPYAAAHIMMMLGRYSRLVLDSWTRPVYARRIGRETVPDAEIVDRFAAYGSYAGLAFWLSVTEDWLPV